MNLSLLKGLFHGKFKGNLKPICNFIKFISKFNFKINLYKLLKLITKIL
jgi:hypothetical protein